MKLLLIAADRREFAGFLPNRDRQGAVTPIRQISDLPVHWSRTTTLGPHESLLVTNGAGANRAAAATQAAAAHFHPDAIISTGFCGALDPTLQIAGIIIATAIESPPHTHPAHPVAATRPHHSGPIITIDHIARTAAEKLHLRQSGAIAVEMEASGVASTAKVLGLPFYCIRAVTDLSSEDMANDFNAALKTDGHFDTINVLTGALRHPTVRVPELLRLRSRAVRAARSLGAFFIDCRF